MDNKQLFIDGYLNRISEQFNIDKNTAFEIFSIAAITERPFQEVYDDIQIRQKLAGETHLKGKDGGIDGAVLKNPLLGAACARRETRRFSKTRQGCRRAAHL